MTKAYLSWCEWKELQIVLKDRIFIPQQQLLPEKK